MFDRDYLNKFFNDAYMHKFFLAKINWLEKKNAPVKEIIFFLNKAKKYATEDKQIQEIESKIELLKKEDKL